MSAYFAITSHAPAAGPLILVNGPPYEPWVLVGKDLGNPAWEHQYSGERGTRGSRAAEGRLGNRDVAFTLLLHENDDKDVMAQRHSEFVAVVDELRRFGGRITFREHGQTHRQHLHVVAATTRIETWGSNETEVRNAIRPALLATCEPMLLWDECDFLDDFTDGGLATEYTYRPTSGSINDLSWSDGALIATAALTTEKRLAHTGPGYRWTDHQVRVRVTAGATITGLKGGVILGEQTPNDYLEVYLDDNGTNSRLRIDKVVAGARTNLLTENLGSRMEVGRSWDVQGRIEGNVVYAEAFSPTNTSLRATPDNDLDYTLTAAEAAQFGMAASGHGGLVFTPQASGAFLQAFAVEPWTYRNTDRREIHLRGDIPGDAPALADLVLMADTAAERPFGLLAWSPRPEIFSYVGNWGFEKTADGWSAAAVTGVTGAASSVTRVTTAARFGIASGQVVTPATANTGVSYVIRRRFKRGVTYTASVYVRAASSTTNTRLRLGASGDIASETAAALTSTWTLRTVTWTPTADRDEAYLAFEVTAATATTFQIDGALVYEGATPPTRTEKRFEGAAPFGYIDALASNSAAGNVPVTFGDVYNQLSASVPTGGATFSRSYALRPDLLPPDDYTDGEMDVEVWARILVHSDFTGGVTAVVSVQGADTSYTHDWGSAGVRLVIPTGNMFKLYRLGTVTLVQPRKSVAAADLTVALTVAPGTNEEPIGIDHLVLVNPKARACTPTAVNNDDAYPVAWFGGSAAERHYVGTDLATLYETDLTMSSAGSWVGSTIELPTGPVDALCMVGRAVPDGPNETLADSLTGVHFHLAVTPRSHYLRDS